MGPNKRPTIPYPYPQPANHKPIPNNPNPKKNKTDKNWVSFIHTEKYLNLIYKALNLSQISHLIALSQKKKKSLSHSITDTQAPKKINKESELR